MTDTQTDFEVLPVVDTSMKGGEVAKRLKVKECADHRHSVYF